MHMYRVARNTNINNVDRTLTFDADICKRAPFTNVSVEATDWKYARFSPMR